MGAEKVALYCRLSKEDKIKEGCFDESESIQNQKSLLINYALERNWEIYRIYSDENYTGADRRRPEFNQLLKDAEEHKFDIILCKSQSRFSRELELIEKYINGLFFIWGIRFVSIADNADTNNAGNKKSRQINGLVNEWYLEDLSDNIKSVLTNKRKQGYYIGAVAPYGYKKDPDRKGHLIIDEAAAEVVRKIFLLYSQGYGRTAIAKILNDEGILNPSEYKYSKGILHKHKGEYRRWNYGTVNSIIKNQVYIGNLVQNRYKSESYKTGKLVKVPEAEWIIAENTHEPIIDRQLWDEVQHQCSLRTKTGKGGEIGIFAGKVRCKECGSLMQSGRNSNGTQYLRCQTKYISADECRGCYIPVKLLEDAVLKELNKISEKYLDETEVMSGITIKMTDKQRLSCLKARKEKLQKRKTELLQLKKNLYIDKAKGVITETDYIEYSKDFTSEIDYLLEQIQLVNENMGILSNNINSNHGLDENVLAFKNIPALSREFVVKLIDCIYVNKRNSVNQKIDIYWSF